MRHKITLAAMLLVVVLQIFNTLFNYRARHMLPTALGWQQPVIACHGAVLIIQREGELFIPCVSTNSTTGKAWYFKAAIPTDALQVITNHTHGMQKI